MTVRVLRITTYWWTSLSPECLAQSQVYSRCKTNHCALHGLLTSLLNVFFASASWHLIHTHTSFRQLIHCNQSLPIASASFELEHRKGFIWSRDILKEWGLPSWVPGRLPVAPHILFSLAANGNHELTEGLPQQAMKAAGEAWISWLVAWRPWFFSLIHLWTPFLLRRRRKRSHRCCQNSIIRVYLAHDTIFKWVLWMFKTKVTSQIATIVTAYTYIMFTVCWAC